MDRRAEFALTSKRVFVAGHRGLVGSAVVARLTAENCTILTVDKAACDLRDRDQVHRWMAANRPDIVVVAAAKVGGIQANSRYPADFLYDNLAIATNLIHTAHQMGVERLLFLGAACVYPRLAPQPMAEEALLEGPPEPTNEAYSVAKIAGIKLCQSYRRQHGSDFISAIPANLYGPRDNFDVAAGHVIPGLIRRAHTARLEAASELAVWGTGAARREFMHIADCADGLVFLLKHYSDERPINLGGGTEISIADLTGQVAEVTGYRGRIVFDHTKPDGMPRKLLDSSRLAALGWRPSIGMADGLRDTYEWFLANAARL